MPSLYWQLQLHPYHIVWLAPVEYLQPWRGFFAGITLPECNALLLRLKVGGQGTILRTWCYALMSHSHPQPPTPPQTTQLQPNFTTWTKCWPNFTNSTKFHNFNLISEFQPNFRILTKHSEFRPNFRISTKFQNFNQISEFQPNFWISTNFRNFDQILEFVLINPFFNKAFLSIKPFFQ